MTLELIKTGHIKPEHKQHSIKDDVLLMPLIFELYKVQLKMNIKQHSIKDDVLLMPLIFELYKVQLKMNKLMMMISRLLFLAY